MTMQDSLNGTGKYSPASLAERQKTEAIYLTNGCTEVAHGSKELFDIMGLPSYEWQNDFYPLSEQEVQFIAEDAVSAGEVNLAYMGYVGLYQGKKWYMPCVEFWGGENPTDEDMDVARKQLDEYMDSIRSRIESIGGKVIPCYDDTDDRHTLQILIPVEYVVQNYSTFEDWKARLMELAR